MDLGLAAAHQAEDEPPKKLRAVAKPDTDRKLLLALAKLSLSNSLQTRALRSIVITQFKMRSDAPFITATMEATKKFTLAAKALRDQGNSSDTVRSRLGVPHIHAWNACVGVLHQRLLTAKKPEAEMVGKFISQWTLHGWAGQHHFVKHFVASKMYDREVRRLEVSVHEVRNPYETDNTPADVWALMKPEIQACEGTVALAGMAPRGDLEQQVQAWIDSQNAQSG